VYCGVLCLACSLLSCMHMMSGLCVSMRCCISDLDVFMPFVLYCMMVSVFCVGPGLDSISPASKRRRNRQAGLVVADARKTAREGIPQWGIGGETKVCTPTGVGVTAPPRVGLRRRPEVFQGTQIVIV